jgi:hypothetical protein
MGELGTDVSGIGAYLSDHRLAVPEYQRSYSWGIAEGETKPRDEVLDLWEDLSRAIETPDRDYFLGAVVTIRNESRVELIDGQQRLATVSLLYAAMRDVFRDHADDDRAQQIEAKFLGEPAFGSREQTQFLTLNAEDNEVFRQLTVVRAGGRTVTAARSSHKRLVYTFEFFRKRFTEMTSNLGSDEWSGPLVKWYEFVRSNAFILEISVPNQSRGFVIFETLNDRGLNLSTADLLKNHLFGTADTRLPEVRSQWLRAVAPFEEDEAGSSLDTFLRHFWASRQGVVRVKGLFNDMKRAVGSSQQAVDFADDLARASRLWAAMFDVSSDVWRDYDAGSMAALEILMKLNVEQCRPLLLAALQKLPRTDIQRLLKLVVNWSVRWMIVGGGSAGTTEALYADTAKKITAGSVVDAAAIVAIFDARVPSDTVFQTAFETCLVRNKWQARYYLRVLERTQQGAPDPEFVPNTDVSAVNLEHVLPQRPDPGWSAIFNTEQAEAMVYRLGNLCLLRTKLNSTIANGVFSAKQGDLAASQYELTKMVGQKTQWTAAEIADRQIELAKLAPRAWPKA